MSAPTRPRPSTRQRVARGSAVGLGLLVASTAYAPAALADDETDGTTPAVVPNADAVAVGPVLVATPEPAPAVSGPVAADFGSGKQFDLALSVDPDSTAPAALSLAGAEFAFTLDGDTSPSATCVTDATGSCTVTYGPPGGTGSSVSLWNGTYTVTQVAGVDGLAPVAGTVGTVAMDVWWFPGIGQVGDHVALGVTNVSQYSGHVRATVVDEATGDPLPGAAYSLSGPWYPSTDTGSPAGYESGTVTSDADGILTFDGPFRPEDWTLTPQSVPDGYVLGDALTLTVPATPGFAGPEAWELADPIEVLAAQPPQEETPSGDGGNPVPTPAPPVVAPPAPVPPAAPSSSAPASPSSASSRQRSVAPVAADVVVPAPQPVAVPTATYDGRSSLPQDDRSPNTAPAPALSATPELQTASSSIPQAGLVGIGILFVAVVAGGVVLVRRRLRG